MTFLSSIKEAWGYEDESGPDTTRFPGLMEYLNQIAKDPQEYEQACQHLQEMQARVLQARLERETEYGRSESKLAVDVKELVEQNLDAYRETEVSLQECRLDPPTAGSTRHLRRSTPREPISERRS